MKNLWIRKAHITAGLFVLLAGSVGLLSENITAAPRPMATLGGRAMVKRKNLSTTTTLQANDKLYPGDVVTGGQTGATVQFSDGSRVDMAGRSVIEITSSGGGGGKTLFRALNGRMAAHLRPGKVVATRSALVRVKGTVILIDVEDDGTSTLSVLEGAAEFYNPCGSVIVPAGAESTTQPGNSPSPPAAIPDVAALLRNWQNQSGVLAPFVNGNVAPAADTTNNAPVTPQNVVLPAYMQSAATKLTQMTPEEHKVFTLALANIKEKKSSSKDCGTSEVEGAEAASPETIQ